MRPANFIARVNRASTENARKFHAPWLRARLRHRRGSGGEAGEPRCVASLAKSSSGLRLPAESLSRRRTPTPTEHRDDESIGLRRSRPLSRRCGKPASARMGGPPAGFPKERCPRAFLWERPWPRWVLATSTHRGQGRSHMGSPNSGCCTRRQSSAAATPPSPRPRHNARAQPSKQQKGRDRSRPFRIEATRRSGPCLTPPGRGGRRKSAPWPDP